MSDQQAIDGVIGAFFAAFDNRGGRAPDIEGLRALFVAGGVVVKRTGDAVEVMDVEGFIRPRALLTGGRLTDFHEWETDGRTEIAGGLATRWSWLTPTPAARTARPQPAPASRPSPWSAPRTAGGSSQWFGRMRYGDGCRYSRLLFRLAPIPAREQGTLERSGTTDVLLAPIIKLVRAYDSAEWEIFIREWQKGLKGYHAVKRLGGPGDLGRDVVGLCSPEACQGVWDNFQCKHYETTLSVSAACEDAGKIIFHASRGEFSPPRQCSFVAPRGPSTSLRKMLLNPDLFRDEVIATWDVRVASHVVEGEKHTLTGDLAAYVQAYDFSSFTFATLEEVLDDHRNTAYWASRFGGALPPPNPGVTPDKIAPQETVYVGKLLDVYADQTGSAIACAEDLSQHPEWKDDLQKQRVRFFDAEAFMATYRDQTEPGTIESFADEIMDAIDPAVALAPSAYGRLSAALTTAGQVAPASVLAPRAKVRVKQGVCHQLANADRVTWKI